MKLQKLCYILCGKHLGKYKEWLIDGKFKAYPYGPVHPALYNDLSMYGGKEITHLIRNDNEETTQVTSEQKDS